jgi:hypothetical protein
MGTAASGKFLDFLSREVHQVEAALDEIRRGPWRRLQEPEMARGVPLSGERRLACESPKSFHAVSRCRSFSAFHRRRVPVQRTAPGVPGMHGIEWPHIEGEQFLCLEPSSAAFDTRQRLDKTFTDALGVAAFRWRRGPPAASTSRSRVPRKFPESRHAQTVVLFGECR